MCDECVCVYNFAVGLVDTIQVNRHSKHGKGNRYFFFISLGWDLFFTLRKLCINGLDNMVFGCVDMGFKSPL